MTPRYNHIPENWSFRLFQTTSNNGKHHCQRVPFSLDFWFSWSNSVPLRINTSNNHFPHPRSCLLIIYNIPSSEPIFLSLKLGLKGFHFTSLYHPKETESIFCEQIVYSRRPHPWYASLQSLHPILQWHGWALIPRPLSYSKHLPLEPQQEAL